MTIIEARQLHWKTVLGISRICESLGIENRFTNAEDAHALELLCEEVGISCYIHDHYAYERGFDKPAHFTVEPLVV